MTSAQVSRMLRRGMGGAPLIVLVVILALPWLGLGVTELRDIIAITTLTLLVGGLNLTWGFAGELAFGQVAIYAVGAYVTGVFSVTFHRDDVLLGIGCAVVAALIVGLLTGVPALRLGSWTLAMTSFFVVLLVPEVVELLKKWTGGYSDLAGVGQAKLFGHTLSFDELYVVAVVLAALWLSVLRNIVSSRYGASLLTMRESAIAATALGISPYRQKLIIYALAGIPAGVAGVVTAHLDGFLDPTSFNFALAVSVLAASVLGGPATVYGAPLGATIVVLLQEHSSSFGEYSSIVYGVIILVAALALGDGLVGLFRRTVLSRLLMIDDGPQPSSEAAAADPDLVDAGVEDPAELVVSEISRSFGGTHALRGVSLRVPAQRISAIIGPNGSGKTTLVNVICGYVAPDFGTVVLGDKTLNGCPAFEVARNGVARTFQTPIIPRGLTIRQVVASGRYRVDPPRLLHTVLRTPRLRRSRIADQAATDRLLGLIGMRDRAHEQASALPLASKRLVEIARALASRPRVLLLDEVAAGVDVDELSRLKSVLAWARSTGIAIVLIEHNFAFVREIADEIVVLAEGAVIAEGEPEDVARNERVLAEYLGSGFDRRLTEGA